MVWRCPRRPRRLRPGKEEAVRAGDTVLFPPHGGGEIRNDGQELTVVLMVFVGPPVPEETPVAGTPMP